MIDLARLISDLPPAVRDEFLLQVSNRSRKIAQPLRVEAASGPGPFPLAFGQQRLWFLQRLEPGSPAYNYPVAIELKGELCVSALRKSLSDILFRHKALRANFQLVGGEPVQVITSPGPASLTFIDLADLPEKEREERTSSLASAEACHVFDLARDLLWRTSLVRLGEANHLLLISTHHIVFDGWSLGVFLHELAILYGAHLAGEKPNLPDLRFSYPDYVLWQREWLRKDRMESAIEFWRQQLKGAPPIIALPIDRPRSDLQSLRGGQETLMLPRSLGSQLKAICQSEGTTLFMTMLAALKALLHCYSGQADIVLGTDTANRKLVETESLIGFFVNLIALRTDLSGNPTFRQLLGRVRETALQAYAHEDLPFEKVVEALRPGRSAGYTPLVQALFLLQSNSRLGDKIPGLTLSVREIARGTSKFDLVVSVSDTEAGLACSFNYSSQLFEQSTISRMMADYQSVLQGAAADPNVRLAGLASVIDIERRKWIVAHSERQISRFQGVRQGRRRPVSLSREGLVTMAHLDPNASLPLVIRPQNEEVDLIEWTQENRSLIELELLKHGAILFRGFTPNSPAIFESFASTVCGELFSEYGDLPREGTNRKIYGSTPYPSNQTILFHNESSHMHQWPLRQFFFCVKTAKEGGETPIVDCRKIYRLLDPAVIEQFENRRIMYIRNFIEGLDVSWQDFFKTSDRDRVEQLCRRAAIDFEWNGDDLRTRLVRDAIACHPKTGEKVFFNQLQLHHISTLPQEVRQSMLSLFGENDLPRNVVYGDGSPIEDSLISEITETYWRNAARFAWQEGDVLLLDNMITAHARNPYIGDRKIMVAMGHMIESRTV